MQLSQNIDLEGPELDPHAYNHMGHAGLSMHNLCITLQAERPKNTPE